MSKEVRNGDIKNNYAWRIGKVPPLFLIKKEMK